MPWIRSRRSWWWQRLELRRVESQLEQPETGVGADGLASVVRTPRPIPQISRFQDLTHCQTSPSTFFLFLCSQVLDLIFSYPLLEDQTVIAHDMSSNNDSYNGLGLSSTDLRDVNPAGCMISKDRGNTGRRCNKICEGTDDSNVHHQVMRPEARDSADMYTTGLPDTPKSEIRGTVAYWKSGRFFRSDP